MKKNIKVNRRVKVYLFTIIGLLSFFGYKMFYYWPKIFSNYEEKTKLERQYENLLEEEAELNSDIIKLKNPDYIARYAREKYLYSKNGEVIIRIVE